MGLFLAAQHLPGANAAAAVREHVEQVALARELGFDSVLVAQHFLSEPFQMLQSMPLLGRIAAEAEGMTLGTGISLLTLLNPVEVAENAASLHAIADGRFVLGVGIGYRPVENAAFGVAGARSALFEAKLDVVRRLLAGEEVTAEGPGYRLHRTRLSLRPATPPRVWIAANSDAAVRRAARLGDAWLINPHTRLDELERQVRLFTATRSEAGRPPVDGLPIVKEVYVAATDEQALRIARPHLEAKYEAYVEWGQSEVLPEGDSLRRPWDELTGGGRFIVGSPETCAALLREHVMRLGVDEVICRVQWPGMAQADVLRSLRLLAEEVRPAVEPTRRPADARAASRGPGAPGRSRR
jgi:alkanesulfonate monooxygenase SsuD/methylene tetrahydromethanopterin reductase-like flavin-dependent oxidoreductase (luciferase family)